ncbi:MAG: hemerythrin HHE cation-binding protein [Anditalea sp.]
MPIPKNIPKSSIGDLVDQNYVLAAVLHFFGISFFQYEEKSLAEVCKKFKVNPLQIMEELENWAIKKEPTNEELFLHPIEVLVEYLKKKHYFFLRQELPFLSNMISGIPSEKKYEDLLADMRLMFPLFVDDFIHHIHEEENTLFRRISLLHQIERGEYNLVDALTLLDSSPISDLAEAHEVHDDEMEGIRKLTCNYLLTPPSPVAMKVLYHELQNFEKELVIHAKIENDLLFPKAIELEKEVKRKLINKIKWN